MRLFVSLLRNSRKTERGARQFLASLAVRAAPFALLFAGAAFGQDFVWQGQVDGIALLRLHADRLDVQIKEGAPVQEQRYHFTHPLPDTNQNAQLRVLQGRGYVHILEQPRIENQFTLVVSIEDRQPGSSFYSIALSWDSSDRLFERQRGSGRTETISWRGRVDEEALVSCQANSCTSSAERGAPVAAEHYKLSRPLPNQPVEVTLVERMGRGEVRLIEQPSELNHYAARVSIRDPQDGSSDYSFKLEWNRPATGKQSSKEAPLHPVGRGLLWSGTVTGRVRVTVRGGASIYQALDSGHVENARADMLAPLPARSDLQPVLKMLRGRGRAEIVERPTEQSGYQLVFEIIDPGPGAETYEIELDW